MKNTILMGIAMLSLNTVFSQAQTKTDTIRIGNMIIIKKKGIDTAYHSNDIKIERKRRNRNVETNYFLFDIGFANFTDKTNYASAEAKNYAKATRPGEAAFTKNDFDLKFSKSSNFNLWFFIQKLNLANHYVHLKYGLGLETNNYRFEKNISFRKDPIPYVFRDSVGFSKNKLSADYITVPFLINIKTNPQKNKSLSFSAGISAGYLYSSRNKQISSQRGKQKLDGNFDLEKFKISYLAELGLGPVKLYGSYAPKTIFERGLDIKPFNVGLRFGGWD